MKTLAIIPARGGSKRVPNNKTIRDIGKEEPHSADALVVVSMSVQKKTVLKS